jgi:hypothetical protein
VIYKGYEIVESSRHGKAVAGMKKKGSIQVREPFSDDSYLLKKSFPYPMDDLEEEKAAFEKAKKYVDNETKNK